MCRALGAVSETSSTDGTASTGSEHAEEWLSVLAGVRPATAIEYHRDLETYVLPRIGDVRIGGIGARRRIRKLA